MRITVVGQAPGGSVMTRTVTLREFFEGWGPYAPLLWSHARDQDIYIDGHRMRVIVGA